MMITICSSVEFTPKIIEIKNFFEQQGHQVNIPYVTKKVIAKEICLQDFLADKDKYGDILFRNSQPIDFIKTYWDYIKNSDAILVLNLEKKGIKNYIGGNTLMEMGFAYGQGKKIYLYNSLPQKSERIHYLDEIIDMKPIVINGDLSKIK